MSLELKYIFNIGIILTDSGDKHFPGHVRT